MALAEALSGRDLEFERRAVLHLRRTNTPESLPGLCWTRPAGEKDYVIVQHFWLSPEQRADRQMAPCPLCSPHAPSYYRGTLAWFPAERVYRCIGRDCASRHIGISQARLQSKQFKAAQQHAADVQFVYDNLGLVPQMIACAERLVIAAAEIERLGRQLGRVPVVRNALYERTKGNDGQLLVYRETQVERSEARKGSKKADIVCVPVYLGMLSGRALLRSSMGFSRRLRILLHALSALDHGPSDQAQKWLLDCNPNGQALAQARMVLVASANGYARLRDQILDAFDFFSEDNFELIRGFGVHPLNPNHYVAWCKGGEYRIRFAGKEMKVRPDCSVLAALPDWPAFRANAPERPRIIL